jgi:hypothetical protein
MITFGPSVYDIVLSGGDTTLYLAVLKSGSVGFVATRFVHRCLSEVRAHVFGEDDLGLGFLGISVMCRWVQMPLTPKSEISQNMYKLISLIGRVRGFKLRLGLTTDV